MIFLSVKYQVLILVTDFDMFYISCRKISQGLSLFFLFTWFQKNVEMSR